MTTCIVMTGQKTTYMFGMLSTVLLYFIFLIYIMKHKIKINKEGKSFEHFFNFLNQNEMNNNIRI
jgi:flagellar biogenesis protein FliO